MYTPAHLTPALYRALPGKGEEGIPIDGYDTPIPAGWGRYYLPNLSTGYTDDRVTQFRAFFVDCDDPKTFRQDRVGDLPTPSLRVDTARGFHLYWFVGPNSLEGASWKRLQTVLASWLGTDPSVVNPARLMRLPGSSQGSHFVTWDGDETVYPAQQLITTLGAIAIKDEFGVVSEQGQGDVSNLGQIADPVQLLADFVICLDAIKALSDQPGNRHAPLLSLCVRAWNKIAALKQLGGEYPTLPTQLYTACASTGHREFARVFNDTRKKVSENPPSLVPRSVIIPETPATEEEPTPMPEEYPVAAPAQVHDPLDTIARGVRVDALKTRHPLPRKNATRGTVSVIAPLTELVEKAVGLVRAGEADHYDLVAKVVLPATQTLAAYKVVGEGSGLGQYASLLRSLTRGDDEALAQVNEALRDAGLDLLEPLDTFVSPFLPGKGGLVGQILRDYQDLTEWLATHYPSSLPDKQVDQLFRVLADDPSQFQGVAISLLGSRRNRMEELAWVEFAHPLARLRITSFLGNIPDTKTLREFTEAYVFSRQANLAMDPRTQQVYYQGERFRNALEGTTIRGHHLKGLVPEINPFLTTLPHLDADVASMTLDRARAFFQEICDGLMISTPNAVDQLLGWCAQGWSRVTGQGSRAERALFLAGEEGTGKTSLFRALAGGYYAERHPGTKEEALFGSAIVDLGESNFIRAATEEAFKAWASQEEILYRYPFAPNTSRIPCTWLICGSTNREAFVKASTGNRRYIVLKVGAPPQSFGGTKWANGAEFNPEQLHREFWAIAKYLHDLGMGEYDFFTPEVEATRLETANRHTVSDEAEDNLSSFVFMLENEVRAGSPLGKVAGVVDAEGRVALNPIPLSYQTRKAFGLAGYDVAAQKLGFRVASSGRRAGSVVVAVILPKDSPVQKLSMKDLGALDAHLRTKALGF